MFKRVTRVKSKFTNYDKKWKAIDAAPACEFIGEFRSRVREELEQVSYPTRRHEEWKYTNVKNLSEADYEAASPLVLSSEQIEKLTDPGCHNILITNGKVDPVSAADLNSIDGVVLTSFNDYIQSSLPKASELWGACSTQFDTPFDRLNLSMLSDGFVLEIEKGLILDKPIRIAHVCSSLEKNVTVQPRFLLVINDLADVTICETIANLKESKHFLNTVTDIFQKKSSKVNYTKITEESSGTTHICSTKVYLERDASFSHMNACFGGGTVRQDLNVILDGENSEANLNGIYAGLKDSHIDNHISIFHKKPHTKSNQKYKGVLDDQSRGVFNGKVIIERDAQKTDAAQINKNLLLSDKAEVDTKPELCVDADDVKAAHGATVSQLDDNEVFYLQTRGISREVAERMLARGFLEEVLYEQKKSQIRSQLENVFSKFFPRV